MISSKTGRLALYVLLLALMTLLLAACRSTSQPATADRARTDTALAQDVSVYDVAGSWRDQQGLSLKLGDLSGRVRIITMVHTECEHSCPRVVSDMKRIEAALRDAGLDAGYVMFTIDPAGDTPQRLAEYAVAMQLDPNSWTLLTGSAADTRQLARRLGIRYRRLADGDIAHNHVITLLDEQGRIVHRQVGLGTDASALIRTATGL